MKTLFRRVSHKDRNRTRTRRRRLARFETLESRQLLAADISGTIFNDLDGDGVFDQGEKGLANWTVFLDTNQDGSMTPDEPSQITDADGKFMFAGVTAGNYRVTEVVRSGWTATNPATGFLDVTAVDGENAKVEFLNHGSGGTGVITGHVWRDLNNNGTKEEGEGGVAGWMVYLDLNKSKALDPEEPFELTNGDGNYTFTNLLGGGPGDPIDYEVNEVLTAGWEPAPTFSEGYTAGVIEGETTVVHDFANTPVDISRVSGSVWNDANGNGIRDGGEPGLGGWIVFADFNINNLLDAGEPQATTNSAGDYLIVGLEPGTHRIAEVPQVNFRPTSPATGYQTIVASNQNNTNNVDFGNQERTDAAIGGVIYVDRDHDGIRDPSEEGLPGITVYLDDNNNGILDTNERSVVTSGDLFYTPGIDEAGTYRFENLSGGTYLVRQIVPAELSSTPELEREHSVTVGPTDDRSDVDSADRYRPSEIHGFKYEDLNGNAMRDPGEPGIEGVTIFIDLNRNDLMEDLEPRTLTSADGSYSFFDLEADAYVVREIVPAGFTRTFPTTKDGILWPDGTSDAAVGNVSPLLIQHSLERGQTLTERVSLTLPKIGALTKLVDVFLLFDDTGSFTFNSPIVRAAFPNIISQLQTRLTGINLGFGVGRLEEYGNFAYEYSTGRPFILNQPIIASDVPGFSASIQSALDHEAPGYGGDTPETVIEALYQMVTGAGFDGNDNGSVLDSGPAGVYSTQVNPGNSGDVPPFRSFTADPTNGVLPASGSIGGAGFRSGALPIIITATDTGFAYQPKGDDTITGIDGLTVPRSQIVTNGRGTTPFNLGAGVQETITGLNALGALVIGLGTNDQATLDPRIGLEALASLTGAINRTTTTLANGTPDPIAPGDPLYFKIGTGGDPLVGNIADGIVAAIEGAVTAVNVNVTLRASDPRVKIAFSPGVINGLGAGDTATFDVTFTGDGRPRRFDLQFIREGTDVVLGSIPIVLGTPISGDGYEFEDCKDGEIHDQSNFGNQRTGGITPNVAPSFTAGTAQSVLEDAGPQTVANWATNISSGPASEAGQIIDFIVNNDRNALFSVQPSVSPDGTLTYTPAADAFGTANVTVQIHDNGGVTSGGIDTSASQTFLIEIKPINDAPSFTPGPNQTVPQDSGTQTIPDWATNISPGPTNESGQTVEFIISNDSPALFTYQPAVTGNGTLAFQTAPGASGTATVSLLARDDNGTANGGVDTSALFNFTITVTPIPDPNGTKFFVVDQARRSIFEYDANGNHLQNSRLQTEDRAPRGIAANPDATRLWVVDKNGVVFVYDGSSNLLGSWTLQGVNTPEGITVHGNDLWIVDRGQDKVHFFPGGGTLVGGTAAPTTSFALASNNANPMDLVTDGVHVWVVDDTRKIDRVFRYAVDGTPEGDWQIDAANAKPTGLTIDPLDVSHIWIVDASDDAVYQYDAAWNRTTGTQTASSSFPLARLNSNPQGIADPRRLATASKTEARSLQESENSIVKADTQLADDRLLGNNFETAILRDDRLRREHRAHQQMAGNFSRKLDVADSKSSSKGKIGSSATITDHSKETKTWASHIDAIDRILGQNHDTEDTFGFEDFSTTIDTLSRPSMPPGSRHDR